MAAADRCRAHLRRHPGHRGVAGALGRQAQARSRVTRAEGGLAIPNTLVVYESKYGLSEAIARDIGRILGPARVCRAHEVLVPDEREQGGKQGSACDAALLAAEYVVIVTPVYRHRPDSRVLAFVEGSRGWLRQRHVAVVCVGLATSQGAVATYLAPITEVLGDCVVWTGGLGGRIAMDWLDDIDREDVQRAQDFRGQRAMTDLDAYSAEALAEAALEIKASRDAFARAAPPEALRARLDDFLAAHETCTLCTGAGGHVRATPIEYTYRDGVLYLLSEGGEKFAHLIVNPHVSVAVHDPFVGMDKLAGLQLLGRASIVPEGTDEHRVTMAWRGLDEERLRALPFALNLIRIDAERAEFLWSGFAELGYDVRQTYCFPEASAEPGPPPAPPGEPRA